MDGSIYIIQGMIAGAVFGLIVCGIPDMLFRWRK